MMTQTFTIAYLLALVVFEASANSMGCLTCGKGVPRGSVSLCALSRSERSHS